MKPYKTPGDGAGGKVARIFMRLAGLCGHQPEHPAGRINITGCRYIPSQPAPSYCDLTGTPPTVVVQQESRNSHHSPRSKHKQRPTQASKRAAHTIAVTRSELTTDLFSHDCMHCHTPVAQVRHEATPPGRGVMAAMK